MPTFDPKDTQLRRLTEYGDRLPGCRLGKPIHKSTLFKWASKGSGGVILETVVMGASRLCSDKLFAEFMAKCAERRKQSRALRMQQMQSDTGVHGKSS